MLLQSGADKNWNSKDWKLTLKDLAIEWRQEELLPLLEPMQAELHENVAVIEVADALQLVELAANPRIRCFLLGRLSDTAALVDSHCDHALAKALQSEGHMPKIVKGVVS